MGDRVFLRISPWKSVLIFGRKGKLSPRYIESHEILGKVGATAYQLNLPSELSRLHNVFYVSILCKDKADPSILRKYKADPSHVLVEQPLELKENLTYIEE